MSRDIDSSFRAHPDTGDLLVKTGVYAITQAIINLILTDEYERPFQPKIAGKINTLLFEQVDQQTADVITTLIEQLISNYEPRATQVVVDVKADNLNSSYEVTISYQPNVGSQRVRFTVPLDRAK